MGSENGNLGSLLCGVPAVGALDAAEFEISTGFGQDALRDILRFCHAQQVVTADVTVLQGFLQKAFRLPHLGGAGQGGVSKQQALWVTTKDALQCQRRVLTDAKLQRCARGGKGALDLNQDTSVLLLGVFCHDKYRTCRRSDVNTA